MKTNKHKEAVSILFKEYTKFGGKVFTEVFMRTRSNSEVQKDIEAIDLMKALITGKNIKKEWKLSDSEDYKKMTNLVRTINYLNEDNEN